jgi:beta-glucosidase
MSIQHRFAHMPGNTVDGTTGDVLADHYNRWREDVAIMKELGLQAYQFSIAWPRVLPEGIGRVNQKGLDFYDELMDALLEAGITPAPILHVWDFPAVLQDRGGWANRDSAEWFGEYAAVVFERLGDRGGQWTTICEPDSIARGAYIEGRHAPCIRDLYAGLRAMHHVLLAHGRAVQAFRASAAKAEIGTSTGVHDIQPASDSERDRVAAERMRIGHNAVYIDPLLLGRYPAEACEWYGEAWPEMADDDLATISAPIDFLGITYYMSFDVADGPGGREGSNRDLVLNAHTVPRLEHRRTGIEWPFDADGLTRVLGWLRDRYGDVPVVVTEVGAAFDDVVVDGTVDDRERVSYLRDHVIALHRAIDAGSDVRGCYVWSFLDTWEFAHGCTARFGMVHVDYGTLKRTIKSSGWWYREVMAHNRVAAGVAELRGQDG